jgi:hypothetical protein
LIHAGRDEVLPGPLVVPDSRGEQQYLTVTASNIDLPAGQHVMRISMDAEGDSGIVGNFNYVRFRDASTVNRPAVPFSLAATQITPSQVQRPRVGIEKRRAFLPRS